MRLSRLVGVLALAVACGSQPTRTDKPGTGDPLVQGGSDPSVSSERRTAVKPKALSDTVKKGLAWLAQHQLKTGGWGQGDEAPGMGNSGANQRDVANVADTSMALLAFLRAGHTPKSGDHQDTVQRGIEFVLGEIEASDDTSLKVTNVTGTRVQSKIGQYVDTFAALTMLSEAKGTMREGVANARVDAAIRKVVKKIEKNQRENGQWDGQGWAPVLSQALAAKGLNRAAQNGVTVAPAVLERVEKQAQSNFNAQAGSFSDAGGGAGIDIYNAAASTAASRDSAETKKVRAKDMKAKAAKGQRHEAPMQAPGGVPTKAQVDAAEREAAASDARAQATEGALVAKLDDKGFVAGFGNNGGEEFLSYMLISETLVQKGGDQWAKWDAAITKLVVGVQNEDGSWTGHHCITGRTFCTAAALLVLMGDRTPAIVTIAS